MKLSNLSSIKPPKNDYGKGISQAVREVLEEIPLGKSHTTAAVVQSIGCKCPDLPKRQIYSRLNAATKREWFQERFKKDWTENGDTIYTHLL